MIKTSGIRNFTIAAALFCAGLAPWAEAADSANTPRPAQPSQNGPLKPGRSAGVRAAQLPRAGLALIGGSAIIAVVVIAASSGGNGASPQVNMQSVPTTTTAP